MATTADAIITTCRDQIPDPVYDSSGVAQPQTDGDLFRAQTLVRWIDEGVRVVAEQTGWTVYDWTALALTTNQPFYSLDSHWKTVEAAFVKQLRLSFLDEAAMIWPQQVSGSQPSLYGYRRETDHLEVRLLPMPSASIADPQTTLTATFNSTDATMLVTSTASFNSFGYLLVNNNEIVAYQTLVGTTSITQVSRGQAATTAITANNGSPVRHLGLWVKGERTPISVTTYNSIVELPDAFVYPVQLYVLWKASYAQNEYQEARAVWGDFQKEMAKIKADPFWKQSAGLAVRAYGEDAVGPLWQGRVITT